MTKRAKREISLFQYILTISGVQVGFGVLTLPREVAQGANTDGWMSIIIGCAITTLVSLCIVKIMKKHPGYTLLDVLTRYLGKWLGRVAMIFWILYAVLAAVSLIFSLLYVIHIWILPRSPMFLVMILLSIPMVMLACKGVLIISRYAVFTVLFTLWMPLLLFIPLK
ncbi:endospore germination permease, partial [Bacillus wiedmannii]|uniref:endospore germination permease n=1 Tax=Bacillus wiedmannii TaxID=1890302 RepID=UPI0034D3F40B